MNQTLTTGLLAEQLLRFEPDTPCVVHLWVAGSGSTCVAAQACGRRWIGIELMEQYHAAGLRRLYAYRDARAA